MQETGSNSLLRTNRSLPPSSNRLSRFQCSNNKRCTYFPFHWKPKKKQLETFSVFLYQYYWHHRSGSMAYFKFLVPYVWSVNSYDFWKLYFPLYHILISEEDSALVNHKPLWSFGFPYTLSEMWLLNPSAFRVQESLPWCFILLISLTGSLFWVLSTLMELWKSFRGCLLRYIIAIIIFSIVGV